MKPNNIILRYMIEKIPVLPLKDIILLPNVSVPILVGRSKSIQAIRIAKNDNTQIFITTQKDLNVENVKESDLYKIGVLADIKEIIELQDKTIKVLIEANSIAKIKKIYFEDSIYANVELITNYKTEEDENKSE